MAARLHRRVHRGYSLAADRLEEDCQEEEDRQEEEDHQVEDRQVEDRQVEDRLEAESLPDYHRSLDAIRTRSRSTAGS